MYYGFDGITEDSSATDLSYDDSVLYWGRHIMSQTDYAFGDKLNLATPFSVVVKNTNVVDCQDIDNMNYDNSAYQASTVVDDGDQITVPL